MAQSDQNLIFSQGQTITATAASTNAYDAATGTSFTTTFTAANALALTWGGASVFGEDLGIGAEKLPVAIYTGSVAFATLTSLNIQYQGAVDTGGSTTARSGLTWVTAEETSPIAVALLTASIKIPAPYWPHRGAWAAATNGSLPRFYQINYVVAGSNATTGSIAFAGIVQTRDDNPVGFYGSGFAVGA
jgi:hypothetical protein